MFEYSLSKPWFQLTNTQGLSKRNHKESKPSPQPCVIEWTPMDTVQQKERLQPFELCVKRRKHELHIQHFNYYSSNTSIIYHWMN